MFVNGANEYTIEELEELFNDTQPETPPVEEKVPQSDAQPETVVEEKSATKNVEQTKAFAHRLKESTDKARRDEREAIAKSFGYDSYDDMVRQRESKLITDKGLDPEEVSPVLDELVKQRLDNDPRMKELEDLRKRNLVEFGKKELAEISELTGGQITRIDQLSREVVEEWKKSGSLTDAYLKLEGKNLISRLRNENKKGSTNHLSTPGSSNPAPSNKRLLTNEEKQMWKLFNPGISDEELNKKTTDK